MKRIPLVMAVLLSGSGAISKSSLSLSEENIEKSTMLIREQSYKNGLLPLPDDTITPLSPLPIPDNHPPEPSPLNNNGYSFRSDKG